MVQEISVINTLEQLTVDEDLVGWTKLYRDNYYTRKNQIKELENQDRQQAEKVQNEMLKLQADFDKRTN